MEKDFISVDLDVNAAESNWKRKQAKTLILECSLDSLLKKYYPFMLKRAKSFVKRYSENFCGDDAYDLVQELMLRFPIILENFSKTEYETSFESFLIGCLEHIGTDQRRKFLRRNFTSLKSCLEQEIDFKLESSTTPAEFADIRNLIIEQKNIGDREYSILWDYYFYGYDDTEISLKLKIDRSTVWRIRQKTLKKLQNLMNLEEVIN